MNEYKTIDELVIRVDERNTGEHILDLVGLSIDKCFIRSVANVNGTDLSKYKVIHKDDFAISLMQVSRDEKVPVARFSDYDIAIMSPAYPIFRVKDKNIILPEYLEMWFKRPEFDREAAFIAVGGVRGSMPWEDFSNMKVPVPDIEQQKKIVREYQIISDRISLKKKINDNLEDTMYSIFQNSFQSGKKQCFNDKSPDGWQIIKLSDLCDFQYGKMVPPEDRREQGYPIFSGYGITGYIDKYMFAEPVIVVLARGVSGTGEVRISPACSYITNLSIAVLPKNNSYFAYLYQYLAHDNLRALDSGSAQSMITIENLGNHKIAIPPSDQAEKYKELFDTINEQIIINNQEIAQLQELSFNILTTLSR